MKKFIGKKRDLTADSNINTNKLNNNINTSEESSNNTQNTNQNSNKNLNNINKIYSEGIVLKEHTHWINKILILKYQSKHNLISSSADGKIIIYDNYPNYKPNLIIKLFGESGITYIRELKNGSIIACSFGALKQIHLDYNEVKNEYTYKEINYFVICTSYISKCIELNNNNLLFISQQNSIIILEKLKNNKVQKDDKKEINDIFIKKPPIKLLISEICINILQLKDDLFISSNIRDPKFHLIEKGVNVESVNCINFYDDKFKTIYKIKNIYCTKSHENIVKIDDKYVIVGVEICLNEVNWNNKKGIELINYKNFQIVSFYELSNQISSILLYNNFLFIGDNKGYVEKFIFQEKEILKQKSKRIHFYNINSICCDNIYDNELKQNIFLIFTGSNDNKIKIISYFND